MASSFGQLAALYRYADSEIVLTRRAGSDDPTGWGLAFLIGGPDNRQSEYLQILSKLTSVIKDMTIRREILQLETAAEVVALFPND